MSSPRKRPSDQSPEEFQIDAGEESSTARYRQRRQSFWGYWLSPRSPLMLLVGLLALIVGVMSAIFSRPAEPAADIVLKAIAPATTAELTELTIRPEFEVRDMEESAVRFALEGAPSGVKVDEKTGEIRWTPAEEHGPGSYKFKLKASRHGSKGTLDVQTVSVTVTEVVTPPELAAVEPQSVKAGQELQVKLTAIDHDLPAGELQWSIATQPASAAAALDQTAGLTNTLTWTPDKSCPVGPQEIVVRIARPGGKEAATQTIAVQVESGESPAELFRGELADLGIELEEPRPLDSGLFATEAVSLRAGDDVVQLYRYASADRLGEDAESVQADGSAVAGKAVEWQAQPHFFRDEEFIAVYQGGNEELLSALRKRFGSEFVTVDYKPSTEPLPDLTRPTEMETKLVELYDGNKKLFHPSSYETLRTLFANEFASRYESQIQEALGSDYEAMMSWFKENQALQEEFYLAIQPDADNLAEVFKLFNELRKAYPKQLATYGNLGIAIAVCWDQPRGIYDYVQHQRRTKSTLPAQLEDALGNFKYFLDAERMMEGRALFLPWEFQLFLVNHKTPSTERQWALANYLPKRSMIGQCYGEVPYDTVMLETKSQECRLQGQEYNLANIKNLGGVCAMQADFAARVGKSLGVPAEYVGGESRFGEHHAWVMWVELQSVSKQGIRFSLESHGRYRGDRYYVGHLTNPQTGKRMTDRELELYLQTVGSGPTINRQSNLVMRALLVLDRVKKFDLETRFDYLKRVIAMSPGNQSAWQEMALLSSADGVEKKHARLFSQILNEFFKTFALFPDFTWEVFDGLIAFEPELKQRINLYVRLVGMYEAAGRPDLASQARMKLTDLLVEDSRMKEATQGLGFTILKFADEGRFVVAMLDKLDELAKEVEGSDQELVAFYGEFLRKIPRKRDSRPSDYCIQMYQRGISRMQTLNQPALAQQLQAELARIEAGQ